MSAELLKLVRRARDVSAENKVLWWLTLIPTVFLLITGALFVYAFYAPVIDLYELFGRAGSESLTVLILMQQKVTEGMTFIVPLLIVFLLLTILSKNAIIKSIQAIEENKQVTLKGAWDASRGYFGVTLLLVLSIVGLSLSAHAIEVYLRHIAADQSIIAVVNLIMETAIVFCGLFSLHFLLIRSDPILVAMRKSFHLTTKSFPQLLAYFLFLLAVALLVVCLIGAVVGVSYYVSFFAGMLIGVLTLVALVPLNVFLTTLWTLLFLSFSQNKHTS